MNIETDNYYIYRQFCPGYDGYKETNGSFGSRKDEAKIVGDPHLTTTAVVLVTPRIIMNKTSLGRISMQVGVSQAWILRRTISTAKVKLPGGIPIQGSCMAGDCGRGSVLPCDVFS